MVHTSAIYPDISDQNDVLKLSIHILIPKLCSIFVARSLGWLVSKHVTAKKTVYCFDCQYCAHITETLLATDTNTQQDRRSASETITPIASNM